MFLDIPTAAEMAGFSLRHFRRIIEEDQIPIIQIGRKFFILGRDFTSWKEGKKVHDRRSRSRYGWYSRLDRVQSSSSSRSKKFQMVHDPWTI